MEEIPTNLTVNDGICNLQGPMAKDALEFAARLRRFNKEKKYIEDRKDFWKAVARINEIIQCSANAQEFFTYNGAENGKPYFDLAGFKKKYKKWAKAIGDFTNNTTRAVLRVK